jgi:hypothetical protein
MSGSRGGFVVRAIRSEAGHDSPAGRGLGCPRSDGEYPSWRRRWNREYVPRIAEAPGDHLLLILLEKRRPASSGLPPAAPAVRSAQPVDRQPSRRRRPRHHCNRGKPAARRPAKAVARSPTSTSGGATCASSGPCSRPPAGGTTAECVAKRSPGCRARDEGSYVKLLLGGTVARGHRSPSRIPLRGSLRSALSGNP